MFITKIQKKFGIYWFLTYICSTNLKANHNKDYSVVKTFKVGINYLILAFFYIIFVDRNKYYYFC